MQKMNTNGFSRCAEMYIERSRKEGRYSTAHVYSCELKFDGTAICLTYRYVQCIVQASDPGTFALLWAVPI